MQGRETIERHAPIAKNGWENAEALCLCRAVEIPHASNSYAYTRLPCDRFTYPNAVHKRMHRHTYITTSRTPLSPHALHESGRSRHGEPHASCTYPCSARARKPEIAMYAPLVRPPNCFVSGATRTGQTFVVQQRCPAPPVREWGCPGRPNFRGSAALSCTTRWNQNPRNPKCLRFPAPRRRVTPIAADASVWGTTRNLPPEFNGRVPCTPTTHNIDRGAVEPYSSAPAELNAIVLYVEDQDSRAPQDVRMARPRRVLADLPQSVSRQVTLALFW